MENLYPVVIAIGHKHVPRGVNSNTPRKVELSLTCSSLPAHRAEFIAVVMIHL